MNCAKPFSSRCEPTYPDKDKRFQAELVERLAQDAAEDAAYLPLLQVTLEEIWRKGTLTVGSYTNLADAIKQRADKVLAYQDYDAAQPNQPRPPEEQAAILNLCLDLVDVSLDDEARRDVRRRRSKDELVSGAPERARLIDALTQARLLSVSTESGEPTRVEVDLIHETLLSNWDRLRQAIAERRHELRQRVRFEQQLKEWIGQNRSDDYLLSGVRLAEARDLERRDDVALRNADAKDFVRRSVEREEARRQKELDDARKLAEAAGGGIRKCVGLRQLPLYLWHPGIATVATGAAARELAAVAIGQLDIDPERRFVVATGAIKPCIHLKRRMRYGKHCLRRGLLSRCTGMRVGFECSVFARWAVGCHDQRRWNRSGVECSNGKGKLCVPRA